MMDNYKITKVQKHNYYLAVNISAPKSIVVHIQGKIPLVFPNMFIALDCKNGKITDFYLNLKNSKNISILEKHNVDLVDYVETLKKFNIMRKEVEGVSWEMAKLSVGELYKVLPFSVAEKVHKGMIDNPVCDERYEGINYAILQKMRSARKTDTGFEEYLDMFSSLERNSVYPPTTILQKMTALTDKKFTFSMGKLLDTELKHKSDAIWLRITTMKNTAVPLLAKEEIDTFVKRRTDLDADQKNALNCLVSSEPCIITGGAGVGKTTMIEALIKCYSKYRGNDGILLVAPTGKASRRLAEKTRLKASTIHTAVRISPEDGFVGRTPDNPLPHNLVIVDESSMIDTELMYDLLGAIKDGAKIVFVGDHHQLYPVGCGEPFVDFLKVLSVYHLTINHRQSENTDILSKAEDAWNGKAVTCGRGVEVYHINESEIASYATDDKVQYVSPYNSVNAVLNEKLKRGKDKFNVGDRIILLRNTKDYCNGDVGILEAVFEEEYIVRVENKAVSVKYIDEEDMALAYSITIHKMQGSENEKVTLFVPENDSFVDNRMMYTAITRSRSFIKVFYYKKEA